jgi:hypothetical protein
MYCEHCGSQIFNGGHYCSNCGAPAPKPYTDKPIQNGNQQYPNQQYPNQQQVAYPRPIVIKRPTPPPSPSYTGLVIATFSMSIASLVFCWVPILDSCLIIASAILIIISSIKVKRSKFQWMLWTAWGINALNLFINIFTLL